jgi:DNA helicase-2/ATP-dependent DNA helicase PcrA
LPRFTQGIFPSSEGTSQWPTNSDVVPVDLRDERKNEIIAAFPPRLVRIATKPIDEFKAACKIQDDLDERRLAYVAITRSTDILFASSSAIADFDTQVRGVSPYLIELRNAALEANITMSLGSWFEFSADDKPELPVVTGTWPVELNSTAMTEIQASAQRVLAAMDSDVTPPVSSHPVISQWDDAIDALNKELEQSRQPLRTVELPKSLSVTHIQRLAKDAEEFVHDLVRPMPAKPAPAAAQGTAFHAWLEKRSSELMGSGHQPVLPGIEDIDSREVELLDTPTLQKFRETFEKSEWSKRVPIAIEEPFGIMFGGHLIRGRIDAVFEEVVDGRTVWTLVDWKTNSTAVADPLQLSIYRLAWAASKKVSLDDVKGAFYYVALDQTVIPEDLKTYEEVSAIIEAGYIPEI